MTTKQQKVLNALTAGRVMTAKQIGAQFKVPNPSAVISDIRRNGTKVVLTEHVDSRGRVSSKYSLVGKRSR